MFVFFGSCLKRMIFSYTSMASFAVFFWLAQSFLPIKISWGGKIVHNIQMIWFGWRPTKHLHYYLIFFSFEEPNKCTISSLKPKTPLWRKYGYFLEQHNYQWWEVRGSQPPSPLKNNCNHGKGVDIFWNKTMQSER